MTQITASVKAYASRQERHQRRLERHGSSFAARYTSALTLAADRSLRAGNTVRAGDLDVERAVDELTDLSVLSYLEAMRIAKRRRLQSQALDFAYVPVAVRRAADQLGLELSRLRPLIRSNVGPLVKGSTEQVRRIINEEIRDAIKRGVQVSTARRRVIARLERFGVSVKKPAYIDTMVRTSIANAYNAALYVENKNDPTVYAFQYVTMNDDRVRESHEILHGMTRKRDDPIWQSVWPPNGYNCRCQIVPIRQRVRQTRIPRGLEVSSGFKYNPGELLLLVA